MVKTGYRQLILMRHAKTEQSASSDRARELTSRGRRDSRSAGGWLRENAITPSVVLTSSAARARATADIVCGALDGTPDVRVEDDLYGASAAEVVETIQSKGGEARVVLVVGHNPTMEELAHALQKDPADPLAPHLPTAGLAVLEVPAEWSDLEMGSAALNQWHVPRG